MRVPYRNVLVKTRENFFFKSIRLNNEMGALTGVTGNRIIALVGTFARVRRLHIVLLLFSRLDNDRYYGIMRDHEIR